jgi:hypothetical protein
MDAGSRVAPAPAHGHLHGAPQGLRILLVRQPKPMKRNGILLEASVIVRPNVMPQAWRAQCARQSPDPKVACPDYRTSGSRNGDSAKLDQALGTERENRCFTDQADYANPIDPSAIGGSKLANGLGVLAERSLARRDGFGSSTSGVGRERDPPASLP